MISCDVAHDVTVRSLDGDLDPREALAFGRHLQSCTACKIRLHREHRLKEMLERNLTDPIAVSDGFTRDVMDRLPQGPPPRTRRRALRLAAWLLPVAGAAAGGAAGPLGGANGWAHTREAAGRTLLGESGPEILTGWLAAAGRAVASAGIGPFSGSASEFSTVSLAWVTAGGCGTAAAASVLCGWLAWRTAHSGVR